MSTLGYMITGVISLVYVILLSILCVQAYVYAKTKPLKTLWSITIVFNFIAIVYLGNSLYEFVR